MTDNSDPRRDALHAFLQEQGPPTEGIDGALLTGWVCVLEWVAPDGDRWLTRGWAPTTSEWSSKGMMHEALFGQWPNEDDEPNEDDDPDE